jgi:hypothetical protein
MSSTAFTLSRPTFVTGISRFGTGGLFKCGLSKGEGGDVGGEEGDAEEEGEGFHFLKLVKLVSVFRESGIMRCYIYAFSHLSNES